jgi:arylsulfatase A-like enzyme
MPGVDVVLSADDPTIAELLKPLGYATGQFGKNHLGDLNKFLPTAHGSTSFSATCTTSTPRKNLSIPITPPRRKPRGFGRR